MNAVVLYCTVSYITACVDASRTVFWDRSHSKEYLYTLVEKYANINEEIHEKIFPWILDEAVLPNYPYRDDGILVYNVIKDYVTNILNIYYGLYLFVMLNKEHQRTNWSKSTWYTVKIM